MLLRITAVDDRLTFFLLTSPTKNIREPQGHTCSGRKVTGHPSFILSTDEVVNGDVIDEIRGGISENGGP